MYLLAVRIDYVHGTLIMTNTLCAILQRYPQVMKANYHFKPSTDNFQRYRTLVAA
jgi:hypothetical protein